MALVYSYAMTAKTGSEDALLHALEALGQTVEGIAGSQGAIVLRDRKEARKFLFLEFWGSEHSRKAASSTLPEDVMRRVMAALANPPQTADYHQVTVLLARG